MYPFGVRVHYLPGVGKATSGWNKFGTPSIPGMLVGYPLNADAKWTKDFEVATLEKVIAKPDKFCATSRSPKIHVPDALDFPLQTRKIVHNDLVQ